MAFLNFGKKKDTGFKGNLTEVKSVKVLGAGCKACHELYENTRKAIKNAGMDIEAEYITDMEKVMSYSVMSMPALVINEKVVSFGRVLKPEEIEKMLCETGKIKCEGKPKVAFVCVHNSCRSQIAEALGKKFASDVFESYSAGTEIKDRINPDAVRMMKKLHGTDMEKTQHSKLITDIPKPDVVIFMGCNVSCPNLKAQYEENWGLDDPTGQSDEVFEETIKKIEENILKLRERLL